MNVTPKSYHNAGHAVAEVLLRDESGQQECANPLHAARWEAERNAMIALGSIVAETMFAGEAEPEGARNDVENALRHLAEIGGDTASQWPYLAFVRANVESLLGRNRALLERVARALESDPTASAIAIAETSLGAASSSRVS